MLNIQGRLRFSKQELTKDKLITEAQNGKERNNALEEEELVWLLTDSI